METGNVASGGGDGTGIGGEGGTLGRRDAMAVASGLILSGLAASPASAASGVRVLDSAEPLRPAYDIVIVGAGSAGCVLAHRLEWLSPSHDGTAQPPCWMA